MVGRLILSVVELKLLPVTDCHVPLNLCGPHRACGELSESHRLLRLISLGSRVPSFPAQPLHCAGVWSMWIRAG